MSTSEVLVPNENASNKQLDFVENILDQKASPVPDEALQLTTKVKEVEDDEKPVGKNKKSTDVVYTYTKDEMLALRSAELSLKKPDILSDEFFRDGIWDPEAWHKSSSSRSASPAVTDCKVEGKKFEMPDNDDGIELAPRRQSFKQGCQVKTPQSNGNLRPIIDRKSRLTGRAANQRRPVEPNYKDSDSISESAHEFEMMRKAQHYDRKDKENRFADRDREDRYYDNDRGNHYSDRSNAFSNKNRDIGYDNDNNTGARDRQKFRVTKNSDKFHNGHSKREEQLPEWMTDGPTSQLDTIELTGFKDIEEEKKAFAARKKKKVRISPDVGTQEIYKTSKVAKRNSPSPKPDKEKPVPNKQRTNSEKSNEKASFDINNFFQDVNYYPPDMFHEDLTQGDGVKSRFTQWFQTKQQQHHSSRSSSRSSSLSRPPSEPLLPDEVFSVKKQSPVPQQPYFTPIQPAPALLSAAANAHAVQTSNIANIIQKQKQQHLEENLKKANKEVRGRLNVEELEGASSKPTAASDTETLEKSATVNDTSAFNMFLSTMKAAGQLPEKPSPVVTGLPGHLLPQPPTRTSPVFEKLKRSLSRSPSPKEFVKAVSTVAGILSSNPSIDRELAVLQKNTLTGGLGTIGNELISNDPNVPVIRSDAIMQTTKTLSSAAQSHFQKDSFSSPSVQSKKTPKIAFTPTSVIKKMHSERKEDCASPSLTQDKNTHSDVSIVSARNNGTYPDLLPEQGRNEKMPLKQVVSSSSDIGKNLDKQFDDAATTPNRSRFEPIEKSKLLPFHSAPATPRNQFNTTLSSNTVSASAPGTPDHRRHLGPPSINRMAVQPPGLQGSISFPETLSSSRESAFGSVNNTANNKSGGQVLMALSAFQTINRQTQKSDVGVIGSGIPQKSNGDCDPFTSFVAQMNQMKVSDRASPRQLAADPKLAPGNGVPLRQSRALESPGGNASIPINPLQQFTTQQQSGALPQPQSQQQQLLQAQRMAQIHQAQLLQQQKLREIAKQANQQSGQQEKHYPGTNSVRPLLPDPEKPALATQQQAQQKRRPLYQQSQHQQLLAYQQQQQQQQQQMLAQHQQRSQLRGVPFPPSQVRAPGQQQHPQLPIPLQQPPPQPAGLQPFQQNQVNPGFPNVNLAAQALVQQQLINQAARARLLAHAQLLQQQPQVVQAALMAQAALVRGQAQAQAAMMLNPRNLQAMAEQMGIRHPFNPNNKHIPPPSLTLPSGDASNSNAAVGVGGQDSKGGSVLSKWFSNDILQQMPTSNGPAPAESCANVMSVEELERKQNK